MWMRMFGFIITFAIIGYLFYAMNASDKAVKNALDKSPAVQEQKKILKEAGVNADDPDALKRDAEKKAKEIDDYQHSADDLPKEP
ncbi:MAG: hypothetical protein ACAH83_03510 [Alphaproteobacteria bacterium]